MAVSTRDEPSSQELLEAKLIEEQKIDKVVKELEFESKLLSILTFSAFQNNQRWFKSPFYNSVKRALSMREKYSHIQGDVMEAAFEDFIDENNNPYDTSIILRNQIGWLLCDYYGIRKEVTDHINGERLINEDVNYAEVQPDKVEFAKPADKSLENKIFMDFFKRLKHTCYETWRKSIETRYQAGELDLITKEMVDSAHKRLLELVEREAPTFYQSLRLKSDVDNQPGFVMSLIYGLQKSKKTASEETKETPNNSYHDEVKNSHKIINSSSGLIEFLLLRTAYQDACDKKCAPSKKRPATDSAVKQMSFHLLKNIRCKEYLVNSLLCDTICYAFPPGTYDHLRVLKKETSENNSHMPDLSLTDFPPVKVKMTKN